LSSIETNYDEINTSIIQICKQHLPLYMVPAQVVLLNDFPVNSNGKVDRNQLRDFQTDINFQLVANSSLPIDQNTAKMLNVILIMLQNILQREMLNPEKSLLEQGVNSLHIMKLHSKILYFLEMQNRYLFMKYMEDQRFDLSLLMSFTNVQEIVHYICELPQINEIISNLQVFQDANIDRYINKWNNVKFPNLTNVSYAFMFNGTTVVNPQVWDMIQKLTADPDCLSKQIWTVANTCFEENFGVSLGSIIRDNPVSLRVQLNHRTKINYLSVATASSNVALEEEVESGVIEFMHPKGLINLLIFMQPIVVILHALTYALLNDKGQGDNLQNIFCGYSLGELSCLLCIQGSNITQSLSCWIKAIFMRSCVHYYQTNRVQNQFVSATIILDKMKTELKEQDLKYVISKLCKALCSSSGLACYNVKDSHYILHADADFVAKLQQLLTWINETRNYQDFLDQKINECCTRNYTILKEHEICILLRKRITPIHTEVFKNMTDWNRILFTEIVETHPISHHALVNRFVPCIIGSVFKIEKEYIMKVNQILNSTHLISLVQSWDKYDEQSRCNILLVEILSHMSCKPVIWYESCNFIMNSKVECLVEISTQTSSLLKLFDRVKGNNSVAFMSHAISI